MRGWVGVGGGLEKGDGSAGERIVVHIRATEASEVQTRRRVGIQIRELSPEVAKLVAMTLPRQRQCGPPLKVSLARHRVATPRPLMAITGATKVRGPSLRPNA